jgi:hypothetical protein
MIKKTSILLLFLFLACENNTVERNSVGWVKFTLNGGGYNNQTFELPEKISVYNKGAYYDDNADLTIIDIFNLDLNNPSSFSLKFPGNDTATFDWGSNRHLLFVILSLTRGQSLILSKGQTTITRYEDVGGLIEGHFEGIVHKILKSDDLKSDEDILLKGTFSIKRIDNR